MARIRPSIYPPSIHRPCSFLSIQLCSPPTPSSSQVRKIQTFSFFCGFEKQKNQLLVLLCLAKYGDSALTQDSPRTSHPTRSLQTPSRPVRNPQSQNQSPLFRNLRVLNPPTPCRPTPGTLSPSRLTLFPPASSLLALPSLRGQNVGKIQLHRNDSPLLLFSSPSPSTSPVSSSQLPPAPSMAPSSA